MKGIDTEKTPIESMRESDEFADQDPGLSYSAAVAQIPRILRDAEKRRSEIDVNTGDIATVARGQEEIVRRLQDVTRSVKRLGDYVFAFYATSTVGIICGAAIGAAAADLLWRWLNK